MNIVDKYRQIAARPEFRGWPLVGDYKLGHKIPFFGQVLEYQLRTGNGVEDYFSLLRHFGWCVVFGVTVNKMVPTLVQWKPGSNQAGWELPPGGIGKITPGTPMAEIESRTREAYLRETGYGGGEWAYLSHDLIESGKYRGFGPHDHGLPAHLFLATGLEKFQNSRSPELNEIMETLEVPLRDFRAVMESGLFRETSAKSCAYEALIKLGVLAWA